MTSYRENRAWQSQNQGQKGPKPERPIPERPNTRKAHTRKAQYNI